MIELPLIFASGLFGTAHCMGMCGPFAIAIGTGARSRTDGLLRQVLYGLGRIATYSFLGAMAGYAGLRFATAGGTLINVQAGLAILAGVFLIYQGLLSAGVLQRVTQGSSGAACLAAPTFRTFLTSPRRTDVFLAGLLTGFLPCGLLYGVLLLAAETQHVGWAMLLMAVFGTGTLPLMTLIGFGGSIMQVATRKRLLMIAGWCIVLAGVVSLARGVTQWRSSSVAEAVENCPFCETT